MKNDLVKKSEKLFFEICEQDSDLKIYLPRHIKSLAIWIKRLLSEYPTASSTVVWISMYLHDIGQIKDRDRHHIISEKMARAFLGKNTTDQNLIDQVSHCILAHRCKEIMPESLEAKILAVADSASHMVGAAYIDLLKREVENKKYVLEKLDRDYRDVNLLPKFQKELEPLYKAWKQLIEVFPE